MKTTRLVLILWVGCWPFAEAVAHPGGLDASGGHLNHSTGEYHFHGGGGGGGFGLGLYSPSPRVRVRARTSARTASRTEANLSGRQPAIETTYTEQNVTPTASIDPEERAKGLLRLAKLLIDQKKIPGAISLLRELVSKYPETQAAKEGSPLLSQLQGAGKK